MATTGTATVMFTDVVDSTGLRARHGDDVADAIRRVHDDVLRTAVAEHGGTVVKGLGDGAMATFPSASQAVAAAVAAQQAVEIHNRRSAQERLAVRVGLSAGDVLWEAADCFGRPVIEAARLCAAAEGGQVLVSDVVRLLARSDGSSSFRSVGALQLKGLEAPIDTAEVAWEPLAAVPLVSGQPPLPGLLDRSGQLPFAGRAEQVDEVLQLWKKAAAGERQALLLSGEPGIGKTRLAAETAARAHDQGATVLYGRCEQDLGAPYQPFAEALDQLVTAVPADLLRDLLGRHPEELVRLVPSLGDAVPDLPEPLHSDAEAERYRLFEAVASCVTAAGAERGLVLVLDDLHWATRPTLVLLQHVLHATAQARLLVIGTYRDTDLGRLHPLSGLLADLRRVHGATRLALTGLDLDGVTVLVGDAAGHELDEQGRALAAAVHAETEGNPFFVGEVLRHLRETNRVYQRDGRWVSDLDVAQLGIPEGIREVVGRRLDHLSDHANAALPVAAVIGRDFRLELLAAATELPEDAVMAGLEDAVAARLVEETGVGCYRFAHALVRATLYEELSATRRARLHARVAEHLERLSPDDVVALAHHFAAASVAGDLDKAARYSAAAGDLAVAQLAHDTAVGYYAQALELLDAAGCGADARRCEALLSLGDAQLRSGDAAYRQTLFSAADIAVATGDDRRLVRAALANNRGFWSIAGEVDEQRMELLARALAVVQPGDPDRPRLLGRLSTELMFTDDRSRREQLAQDAVREARATGDRLVLADVLAATSPTAYTAWAIGDAASHSFELLEIAKELADPYRLTIANLWCFTTAFFLGSEQAVLDAYMAEAEQLVDEVGQPTLQWVAGVWRAMFTQMQGCTAEAAAQAEEAFEVGQRAGQPDAWTWYSGQLVTLARDRGEIGSFVDVIEREVATSPGLPVWEVTLAVARLHAGRPDEVRRTVERLVDLEAGRVLLPEDIVWLWGVANLLELAAAVGALSYVPLLYDLLLPFRHLMVTVGVGYAGSAELYLAVGARATGRLDDAVAHCERAVAAHERMGARLYLGLSYAELATVLQQKGDEAGARAARARAEALAAETGSGMIRVRLDS